MGVTIGVDLGGTKIGAGVVDATGRVLQRLRVATPAASQEQTTGAIVSAVLRLAAERGDVEAVGIGAPGLVSGDRSTVLFAPNVRLRDDPLGRDVSRRTGLRVVVENDANAAAWGEAQFGAARGAGHVLLLTVGTGLGAGIVVDGALLRGAHGLGAEVGHMNMVPGGRPCGCGQRGCFERYASGSALALEAVERISDDPPAGARVLELGGGGISRVTGVAVTRAAREGDPLAVACVKAVGSWLGVGIADLTDLLDPEVIVVGGGLAQAGAMVLEPLEVSFRAHVMAVSYRPLPRIVAASLGQDAGIVGAADLARR